MTDPVTRAEEIALALANLNLNFHTLALDGAYAYPDSYEEAPRFFVLLAPRHDEVGRVLAGTARRIARLLDSRAEEEDDAHARDEPLLAALASASLRTRIAEGSEQCEPWRRIGDRVDPRDPHDGPDATPHVSECRGMTCMPP